jgi:hypothetical protein
LKGGDDLCNLIILAKSLTISDLSINKNKEHSNMSTRKVQIGAKPQAGGGNGGGFWSPKADEVHEVTLLADDSDIVSVEQCSIWDYNPAPSWIYCGPDDPSHDLKLKPGVSY